MLFCNLAYELTLFNSVNLKLKQKMVLTTCPHLFEYLKYFLSKKFNKNLIILFECLLYFLTTP